MHTPDERPLDLPGSLPVDPDVPDAPRRAAGRGAARVLRNRWDVLLVISAGGALGSLARWGVSEAWPHPAEGVPWATWAENVSGAFLLGLLMVFLLDYWSSSRYLRPFLAVGILGGYTTFSTYMLDTRALLAAGRVPAAFGYLFGTLVTALLAVVAGILLARALASVLEHRHRAAHEVAEPDPPALEPPTPDQDRAGRSRP